MKGFLKNIAGSMIQKISDQQHLIPLTPQQIYGLLHKIQVRKRSFHQLNDQSNSNKNNQDIWKIIDKLATITPQKQFKLLGKEPTIQTIKFRCKQLDDHLQQIQSVMAFNYNQYKYKIDRALKEVQCKKSLSKGKKRSKQLKQKLMLIEKVTKLTKSISQKNIKIKNLKDTIQYLKMMPNLKKMNLIELKMLRIQPKIEKLQCIKHIDQYIQRQISHQIKCVIQNLKDLILNFNRSQYQNALRIFILAQQSNINYQRLLLKVLQNQIRNHENIDLLQTTSFYIKIMANTQSVCQFHRQIVSDSNSYLSKQLISINQEQIKIKITQFMDETLAYYSSQIMISSAYTEIYRMLYIVNRFLQIGYSYSRYVFKETIKQIKAFFLKKVKSTSQKYINQLIQNLQIQNSSQWSRMPVLNDFRHQGIDKNLCLFKKYQQSQICQYIQKSQLKFLKQIIQNYSKQQAWQIKNLSLPSSEKIEKYKDLTKMNYNNEVVLSQSGLSLLRHFQVLSEMLFYYPTISQITINAMIASIQFYFFYLYSNFIQQNLKSTFQGTFYSLQDKYLQKRVSLKYSGLYKFIRYFFNNTIKQYNSIKLDFKQPKKEEPTMIRSRIISLQSIKFVLSYLNHIINIISNQYHRKMNQNRIELLQLTIKDLTDVLYIDCITRAGKIQIITNLIPKIRWDDSNHYYSYLSLFITVIKDFQNKVKGYGKGQIPASNINNFFILFWQTMLIFILRMFVKECKPKKIHKAVFQLFLDELLKKFLAQIFYNQKQTEIKLSQTYRKTKKAIDILNQTEWQICFSLIKKSLEEYQYILKLILLLLNESQCSNGVSPKQLKQRQDEVLKWVEQNILK